MISKWMKWSAPRYLEIPYHLGKGEYHAVINLERERMDREGGDSTGYYSIALCQYQVNELEAALVSAHTARRLDGKSSGTLQLLTRIYHTRGDTANTYAYAVQALHAVQEDAVIFPRSVKCVLNVFFRILALLPKFRGIDIRMREQMFTFEQRDQEWYRWAEDYIRWYTETHGEQTQ